MEGPEAQDAFVRKAMKNIFVEEDVTDVDWHQTEPEPAFFAVSYIGHSHLSVGLGIHSSFKFIRTFRLVPLNHQY